MPYELKPRDVERRFFTCEQLIQRQQWKDFLHRIVTGDEKWIFYDNPKKKKYYAKPGQSLPSTSTSTPRPNIHSSKIMLCIWWGQKSLVYYELLKSGDSITGDRYWFVWTVKHCEKNSRKTSKDMIKLFFFMTTLNLMSAKVIKKYLETLKWDVLPHPSVLYSLDIAPSDYWLFRRMQYDLASHRFTFFAEIENWLQNWIASKDESFFRDEIRKLPEREKVVGSDRQYFNWSVHSFCLEINAFLNGPN